jgi:rhodanese-related sulfurtransferase
MTWVGWRLALASTESAICLLLLALRSRSLIVDFVIKTLSPEQAQELITSGDCDVVDVREPREWSRGHLPGARLVPFDRLRQSPKAALPRDNVIFVCAAGVRSEAAAKVAEESGFSNVYNLSGGTRNWVNSGYALVVGE